MGNVVSYFTIETERPNYVFMSLNISNLGKLVDDCVEVFFSEKTTFEYFNCLEDNSIFEPSSYNYCALYNEISRFIDDDISNTRKDKAGKIGEYFLSIILNDYFNMDCIYPKLIDISDNNMSVFGIDALYYSSSKDILMFGEAKFTSGLKEGISLLEGSLSEYDKQLDDEFTSIVIKHEFDRSKIEGLRDLSKFADQSLTLKDFIEKSGMSKIGVPLFVCHGQETDKKEIMSMLESINKPALIHGLNPVYYIISLPINNKQDFLRLLKTKLEQKRSYYERHK